MDNKFEALKPIPLADREPTDRDTDMSGRCYFGRWIKGDGRWIFTFGSRPEKGYTYTSSYGSYKVKPHTHWLPANVEVLPTRCQEPLEDLITELSEQGWVIDRLPTKEDGDKDGDVLIYCKGVHHDRCGWRNSGQAFIPWNLVVAKQPWKPLPCL